MTEAGAAEDGTAYLQARTDFFAGILGLSSEIGQVRHSETAEESLNGQVSYFCTPFVVLAIDSCSDSIGEQPPTFTKIR